MSANRLYSLTLAATFNGDLGPELREKIHDYATLLLEEARREIEPLLPSGTRGEGNEEEEVVIVSSPPPRA